MVDVWLGQHGALFWLSLGMPVPYPVDTRGTQGKSTSLGLV